jgi:hypothetical protein
MLPWAQPTRQLVMLLRLNFGSARRSSQRDPLRAAACRIIQLSIRKGPDAALGVANRAARDDPPSERRLGTALRGSPGPIAQADDDFGRSSPEPRRSAAASRIQPTRTGHLLP